jgi:glutamate dehydrogenase
MPVDLLWNGGIGTYVKASVESHASAGDRANDAVRVDARELRARIVAEGGNLGLTQLARVELALAGVRLDTDAIHNSGGVDLSDHEVNYKILLAPRVADGSLGESERRELLRACVDDAARRARAQRRPVHVPVARRAARARGARAFRRGRRLARAPRRARRASRGPARPRDAARAQERGRRRAVDAAGARDPARVLEAARQARARAVERSRSPSLEPLLHGYFPPGSSASRARSRRIACAARSPRSRSRTT